MSRAIPSLPQYAFMAWCLVKAQGQIYLFYLYSFINDTSLIFKKNSASTEFSILGYTTYLKILLSDNFVCRRLWFFFFERDMRTLYMDTVSIRCFCYLILMWSERLKLFITCDLILTLRAFSAEWHLQHVCPIISVSIQHRRLILGMYNGKYPWNTFPCENIVFKIIV
jgi:hypothetical protein